MQQEYGRFDAMHGNKPVKTYDDANGNLTVELYGRIILKVKADVIWIRFDDYDTTVTRRTINRASKFFNLGLELQRRHGATYCHYKGQEWTYNVPDGKGIVVPR